MSLCDIYDQAKKTPQKPQAAMNDLYLWLAQYNSLTDRLNHDPIEIDDSALVLPEDWGPPAGQQQDPTARLSTPSNTNYDPVPVSGETWENFLDHLLEREGYRNTVYADSEGYLTVGVGHLVLPEDNLCLGDTISDERVRELLESDASKAYKAAVEQANELGINDSDFLIALASVNYQLGTGWRSEFSKTWQHMKDGNFDQAIHNVENSLWSRQTPVRTADFTSAIRNIKDNPSGFEVAAIDTNFNAQSEGTPQEPQVNQPTPPVPESPPRLAEPIV